MFILIASFPVDDVINFELTLAFVSSRSLTWPKNSRRKCKYKGEKSFEGEKRHFHHF